MKILITGGSGFLGWNLVKFLSKGHEVFAIFHKHEIHFPGCKFFFLNIEDTKSVLEKIKEINPGYIIHTAAYSKVDRCENDPETAFDINCKGSFNIAIVAERLKIRLMHFSTDLVFDGKKGNYSEEDEPDPPGIYAKTKLISENLVKEFCNNYLIIRVALMYGWGNHFNGSFINWMDSEFRKNNELKLYVDQYRSMLFVEDVCNAVRDLLDKNLTEKVLHLGGSERINRYDFGLKFADVFGYDRSLITQEYLAKQEISKLYGLDCSMNSTKIQKYISSQFPDISQNLNQMKTNRQKD